MADPAPNVPADKARFSLFDAIAKALLGASEDRPLLVVLEDLHWADQDSVALLEFVARQTVGVSILLVGTFRDLQPDGAERTGIAAMQPWRRRSRWLASRKPASLNSSPAWASVRSCATFRSRCGTGREAIPSSSNRSPDCFLLSEVDQINHVGAGLWRFLAASGRSSGAGLPA